MSKRITEALSRNLIRKKSRGITGGATKVCKVCKKSFPVLSRVSKQPVCDDCHVLILAALPRLRIEEDVKSKRRWEIEEIARKYDGWCNYGKTWASEEYRDRMCNEWNKVITEQNALGRKIQCYEEFFDLRYEDTLTELPRRCNHEFEHLSLTSANGENPMDSRRVEYWAAVMCMKCGKHNLNLHTRHY